MSIATSALLAGSPVRRGAREIPKWNTMSRKSARDEHNQREEVGV